MFRYWFFLILGFIFALTEALLYLFGVPFAARLILPYAVAEVLLIFTLTTSIIVFRRDIWNGLYARTIIIAAAIFLIFAQIIVGVAIIPTGALKIILVFIGSTSFWVTFTVFIGFIFHLLRRNL